MLVLSRTIGSAIILGDDIEIEVVAIRGNQVQLAIRAPREVEIFDDRRFARAPFGPNRAEALIRGLKVARLIDGVRGDAPGDMRAAHH